MVSVMGSMCCVHPARGLNRPAYGECVLGRAQRHVRMRKGGWLPPAVARATWQRWVDDAAVAVIPMVGFTTHVYPHHPPIPGSEPDGAP